MNEEIFWAENIAKKIIERKKFYFLEKEIPKIKNWTVKSSSSLSGVLHIGRLSDLIRSEAVFHALKEKGFPAEFIYVTEDMDPLRKIPKGIPESFKEFIGFPVSDVPDPFGCHESYSKHFVEEFFNVLDDFLLFKPKIFSMREEYKKGIFTEFILKLLENKDSVLNILSKATEKKVNTSIWKPVCDNCGKIQTTVVTAINGTKVNYKCIDYAFESFTAKGCNFEGTADIRKGNGKLIWKSEWATQWAAFHVCSEGAGKEYIAPNSAFWINAEIAEKILGFPMPEPIFYEHLTIENKKMSASLGNVIYPADWLKVSRAETLKYLYLKKLMKSRSFSWKNIPLLELELDRIIKIAKNAENKKEKTKEEINAIKLFEYSKVKGRTLTELPLDYGSIATLIQLIPNEKELINFLIESGQLKENEVEKIKERIKHAKNWLELYAKEEKISFSDKTIKVSEKMFNAVNELIEKLNEKMNANEIQQLIFDIAKKNEIKLNEFFELFYLILIERKNGPKLGTLIKAIGIEKTKEKIRKSLIKEA